jgi:hypothetical protein
MLSPGLTWSSVPDSRSTPRRRPGHWRMASERYGRNSSGCSRTYASTRYLFWGPRKFLLTAGQRSGRLSDTFENMLAHRRFTAGRLLSRLSANSASSYPRSAVSRSFCSPAVKPNIGVERRWNNAVATEPGSARSGRQSVTPESRPVDRNTTSQIRRHRRPHRLQRQRSIQHPAF